MKLSDRGVTFASYRSQEHLATRSHVNGLELTAYCFPSLRLTPAIEIANQKPYLDRIIPNPLPDIAGKSASSAMSFNTHRF